MRRSRSAVRLDELHPPDSPSGRMSRSAGSAEQATIASGPGPLLGADWFPPIASSHGLPVRVGQGIPRPSSRRSPAGGTRRHPRSRRAPEASAAITDDLPAPDTPMTTSVSGRRCGAFTGRLDPRAARAASGASARSRPRRARLWHGSRVTGWPATSWISPIGGRLRALDAGRRRERLPRLVRDLGMVVADDPAEPGGVEEWIRRIRASSKSTTALTAPP